MEVYNGAQNVSGPKGAMLAEKNPCVFLEPNSIQPLTLTLVLTLEGVC